MNRQKPKDKDKDSRELEYCKHCDTKLEKEDIQKQSKKNLTERYSVYWTGIEKPYIQIYKIKCPNPRCRKSYTSRQRKSSWSYK